MAVGDYQGKNCGKIVRKTMLHAITRHVWNGFMTAVSTVDIK
jgi:hypothetical protein